MKNNQDRPFGNFRLLRPAFSAALLMTPEVYAKNSHQPLPTPPATVQAMAVSPLQPASPDFYSSLELRHSTAYYYQKDGNPEKEVPDLRIRVQAGAVLYGGNVDAYITSGAIRYPRSQRVFQKRPEAAVDIYPIKNRFFKIRQYHRLRLPFEKRDLYLRSYDSFWEEREDSDGSVYTIGISPWSEWPEVFSYGKAVFKGGVDAFTFMYSRPVFKTSGTPEGISISGDEDHKPMIGSKQFLSASFQPSDIPGLKLKASLYYHSRFFPVYRERPEGTSDHYGVTRFSVYRLRASISLSKRMTLINDFYHFHAGFFEAKRTGREKRFKNILRVTTLL